jgi:putative membrane protein
MTVADLPALNACLNGLSATFLLIGYYFIKKQRQTAHRNCMLAAFVTSTLFLIGYLTYHFTTHLVTRFVEPAWFRPIYITILITHTLLAPIIVPMILVSIYRGLKGRNESHKKISRWTLPMWMYVSVTGVIIYLLLYQIFPQPKPQPQPTATAQG